MIRFKNFPLVLFVGFLNIPSSGQVVNLKDLQGNWKSIDSPNIRIEFYSSGIMITNSNRSFSQKENYFLIKRDSIQYIVTSKYSSPTEFSPKRTTAKRNKLEINSDTLKIGKLHFVRS
jgi:hypothetical protein